MLRKLTGEDYNTNGLIVVTVGGIYSAENERFILKLNLLEWERISNKHKDLIEGSNCIG